METQHKRAKWPYGVIHLYVHIYIHIILHIVKYIESLECNKLCTNHFGTSHAVSLLQSFIALRLFFTSLADEIASELQRWSCSEAEQGRIYNNELYTQYMGGNYNIYIYSVYIYIFTYVLRNFMKQEYRLSCSEKVRWIIYLDSAVYGDLIGLISASVTMTRKLWFVHHDS
jgi:hypothetical protein